MRDELREFLAGEYQVGRVQSHGTFTLDPERARERLRSWRLSQPQGYALALLAAAVSGGASALEVTTHPHGVQFRLPGLAPCPGRQLLSGLVGGRLARREMALAMALNSALAEGHTVLWEGGGERLTFRGQDEPEREQCEASEVTFTVQRPAPRWSLFARPAHAREVELLVARGAHAPLAIIVNGEALPRLAPPPCLLWAHYAPPGPALLAVGQPQARLTARGGAPGPWEAELRFGGGHEGLVLVVDGVSYRGPLPWPVPGLEVILAAPEVRLDLSWSGPVERPEWHEVLAQVEGIVYAFLEGVEARKEDFDEALLPYVEPLVGRYCAQGKLEQAGDLCAWMRPRWEQEGLGRARFYYRYALVARRRGLSPLAEGLERISQEEFQLAAAQGRKRTVTLPGRAAGDPNLQVDLERAARLVRMEIDQSILGPGDAALNDKLANLASDAERRGEAALALYCWRWLVELAVANGDGLLVWRLVRLGQVLQADSPSQARHVFRRALSLYVELEDVQPRELVPLLDGLSRAEFALGNRSEAVELLRRCVDELESWHGADAPERVASVQLLAGWLEKCGRHREAVQLLGSVKTT